MHPSLLARRPVVAGAFLMLVASGVLIAGLFLGSRYLQHLRGLSALETGLFFLPAALGLMIGAIAAGRLVGTIGTRPVAVVGLVLVAIGNGLLIGLSAGGNVYLEALPGTFLFALGGGPLFVCATTSALGRVGQHEAGLVSGVVNTFNQLGAAICVAVASTVAARGLTRTPSIDGFTDAFTVFTVVAAVAAVVSLRLVPSGTPQMTGARARPLTRGRSRRPSPGPPSSLPRPDESRPGAEVMPENTMTTTQTTPISVHGLTKQFGRIRAVQELTFDVRPGQITGFLGPNGAGKTTTLRMLLGLVRPHRRRRPQSGGSPTCRCRTRAAPWARCWRRPAPTRVVAPGTTCGSSPR